MLIVILVFWSTISIRMAVGFFTNHDPILRPKPFTCQNMKCLYICDKHSKDHATVSIEHFGMKNYSEGAHKIYFLSIKRQFVGIFNSSIYFFKYSRGSRDHEIVLQHKKTFPNRRIIPVGDETVMMSPIFRDKSPPDSQSTLVHLIDHYRINIASKSLVLLQSIAFPKQNLKALQEFEVPFALNHGNYSYIIGTRKIKRSRWLFVGGFCNGYGNYSYTEIRRELDEADDSVLGVFTMLKSIENLGHIEHSILLWVRIDRDHYLLGQTFPDLEKGFKIIRSQCAEGDSYSQPLSSLLAGQDSLCKQSKLNSDPCLPIGENLPSSEYRTLSPTSIREPEVTSLILVHLGFPINKVVFVLTTANYQVKHCLSDFGLTSCLTIGNISELGDTFPPSLDSTKGRIDYHSIHDGSIISVNIVDCSYFERCINCRLFSLFFQCTWNGKCKATPKDMMYSEDSKDISLECIAIESIAPEKIISFDERVYIEVSLTGWDLHEVIYKKDYYDLMVFINSKPCDETIIKETSLMCTLGARKKGVFPIYVEISVKQNTLFSTPLKIVAPINVTIEGEPILTENSVASHGSPLVTLAQGIFCLMVLFVLSLRWGSQKDKTQQPTNSSTNVPN